LKQPEIPDLSGSEIGFHIGSDGVRFKIDLKKKNITFFSLLCFFELNKDPAIKKIGCEFGADYIQIIKNGAKHTANIALNKIQNAFNKGKAAVKDIKEKFEEKKKEFTLDLKKENYNYGKVFLKQLDKQKENAEKSKKYLKEKLNQITIKLKDIEQRVKNLKEDLMIFCRNLSNKIKDKFIKFLDTLTNLWVEFKKKISKKDIKLDRGTIMAEKIARIKFQKKYEEEARQKVSNWLEIDENKKNVNEADRIDFKNQENEIIIRRTEELRLLKEESLWKFNLEFIENQEKKEKVIYKQIEDLDKEDIILKEKAEAMGNEQKPRRDAMKKKKSN